MEEIKRGGLILFFGAAASKLGGMVFKFITMNQLSPELYGELAIFLVLFNWFLLISTVNITLGLSKKISGEEDDNYYKASLIGCGLISLLLGAVIVILSPWIAAFFSIHTPLIIVLLGLAIPLSVFYYLKLYHFRGRYEMDRSVAMDVALMVSRIGALSALFYVGLNLSPYVAFLLSFLIVDLYLLLRGEFDIDIDFSEVLDYFKKIAIYSLPIFVAESFRFFGMGLDRLFLGKFFSTAVTGIYDVGVSLCLGYIVIATSFGNALLPSASKEESRGGNVKGGLLKTLLYVLGLYGVYTLLLHFAARPLISFLNPAYLPMLSFLKPLQLAYGLIGIFTLLIFFLSGIKLQKYAAYSSVVFVILAVALNYFLVPQMKYLGAIYALIISVAGGLLTMIYPLTEKVS